MKVEIMRIDEHPILGKFPKGPKVRFTFDGRTMEGFEGEPIAAAVRSHGVMIHRYTTRREEPRGIFCAIGRCTDCVMVVDGAPNTRACVTALRDGMVGDTQKGRGPNIESE